MILNFNKSKYCIAIMLFFILHLDFTDNLLIIIINNIFVLNSKRKLKFLEREKNSFFFSEKKLDN